MDSQGLRAVAPPYFMYDEPSADGVRSTEIRCRVDRQRVADGPVEADTSRQRCGAQDLYRTVRRHLIRLSTTMGSDQRSRVPRPGCQTLFLQQMNRRASQSRRNERCSPDTSEEAPAVPDTITSRLSHKGSLTGHSVRFRGSYKVSCTMARTSSRAEMSIGRVRAATSSRDGSLGARSLVNSKLTIS